MTRTEAFVIKRRRVELVLQGHRSIDLKRSLKIFGRKSNHGNPGIVAHPPVLPDRAFQDNQYVICPKLELLQVDLNRHPPCQTENRDCEGELDRMIHKLHFHICLFRNFIKIINQDKLFIQMNRRIFCGQLNQIQI